MTPGALDPRVVRRHLAALEGALTHLRRHAGLSAARLRSDADARWAVERGLQLCVQNALDIATHLVVASGLDASDYASAVDRLAELGILPEEFGARFRSVAGFRNVLVHAYLEVDLELVAEILSERLDDFETFARCIEAHLEAHSR